MIGNVVGYVQVANPRKRADRGRDGSAQLVVGKVSGRTTNQSIPIGTLPERGEDQRRTRPEPLQAIQSKMGGFHSIDCRRGP